MGKLNDLLLSQWNYTKNTISPKEVTSGSGQRVWWRCDKGHEWQAAICDRSNYNTKCPYCTNRKICNENCLATQYPHLIDEWHVNRNGDKSPFNTFPGSIKKVWWKCKHGHEWEISPNARTSGNSCPYCSGHKVCFETCLANTHPKLALQWHPKNILTPHDVSHGSNIAVWWVCEKGHEWEISPNTRTSGNNCPYCSGHKVCFETCLATTHQLLASQWHKTKNSLDPSQITAGSNKKVWWICKLGHEWESAISNRTSGRNCPYCSNKKVNEENCLATTHKELVCQRWDFSKNEISPYLVTRGCTKKAWWKCQNNHNYYMAIKNASNGNECPLCKNLKKQKHLLAIVKKILPQYDTEWNYKHPKLRFSKSNRPMELDIFLPEINLAFEYQGKQHFLPIKEWGGKKNIRNYQIARPRKTDSLQK